MKIRLDDVHGMITTDFTFLLDCLRPESRDADAEVDANLKCAQALRLSILSNAFRSESLDG